MNNYRRKDSASPCLYPGINAITKKEQLFYPTVNCDFDCERCGWNPQEKKRRLRTGIRVATPEGTVKIRFKRRLSN